MRLLHSSIGLRATLVLSAGMMMLGMGTVFAAESNSYIVQNDSAAATTQLGVSASYTMNESEITWVRLPASSPNFQIVPPMNISAPSSSASSESSISVSGGDGTSVKTGGKRTRITPARGSSLLHPSSPLRRTRLDIHSALHQTDEETMDGTQPSLIENTYPYLGNPTINALRENPTMHFMNAVDLLCPEQRKDDVISMLGISSMIGGSILFGNVYKKRQKNKKGVKKDVVLLRCLLMFAISMFVFGSFTVYAHAAQTVPTKHVYNGRLLNNAGTAITTSHSIRFSYWKSTDAVAGDTTGTGAINTGASNYANWQEVHTVTPDSLGYFSVELGSVSTLPTYANLPVSTLLSLFLQVDVKATADSDTAYEMLDIDPSDTAIDRSGILSVPFASNADTIDKREIGTSSGSIVVLGPNGQFTKSVIPGGTSSGSFVLDADNTESLEIALQFGATLGKKLTYDIVNSTFRFNANLEVQGNLTVTGLINGVNITQLQESSTLLKASSGGGLNLNVTYGSYRLNGTVTNYAGGTIALTPSATSYVFFGSGGLTARTMAFPTDESFIPVAEVTTSAGSILSVLDRRALSADDRERTVVSTFNPSFEKASYQGDGADNVGQLSVLHDTGSLKNFYNWSSTRSNLQDYDILLKVPVTDDFVRWQTSGGTNPMALTYRTTSSSSDNNKLDIQVYDTNGTAVTLSGSVTGLRNTSWTTTQIEFIGSPTWTAGQDMLIRLKASAKDNNVMKISGLKLSTVELLKE